MSQLTSHGWQMVAKRYFAGPLEQSYVLLDNPVPRVLHLHCFVATLLEVLVSLGIRLFAEPCGTCVADICLEALLNFFINRALDDFAAVLRIGPSVSAGDTKVQRDA